MKQVYSNHAVSKYSLFIIIATTILLGIISATLFISFQSLLHSSGLKLSDISKGEKISIIPDSTTAVTFGICAICIAISLIVYFSFVLGLVHKSYKASNESAIETEYMYNIIRSLSNATIETDSISQTLGIIAQMYDSTKAAFFIIKSDKFFNAFTTSPEMTTKINKFITGISVNNQFHELYQSVLNGNCIVLEIDNSSPTPISDESIDNLTETIYAGRSLVDVSNNPVENFDTFESSLNKTSSDECTLTLSGTVSKILMPQISFLKLLDTRFCLLVPCINSENHLRGMLVVANPKLGRKKYDDYNSFKYLVNVSSDLATVADNIEAYSLIKNMGFVDFTTGLLNRNSYKQTMEELHLEDNQPFACIFVDVNGLHEMNNTYGHEYGDQMLIFVADTLKKVFPEDEVFRIGGDEFIIFAFNHSLSVIDLRVAQINSSIIKAGYSISIGVEWRDHDQDIELMVKEADLKMYAAKKRYYQTIGNRRNLRGE